MQPAIVVICGIQHGKKKKSQNLKCNLQISTNTVVEHKHFTQSIQNYANDTLCSTSPHMRIPTKHISDDTYACTCQPYVVYKYIYKASVYMSRIYFHVAPSVTTKSTQQPRVSQSTRPLLMMVRTNLR